MEKSERIVFADYLRVFACFLVMLVHSSENFYASDSSGLAGSVSMLANQANRLWVSIYDGASRVCVPLFIILSSFLLVPMKPGQTMGSFYKRRFLRILPPVFVFFLLYTFLPLAWGGMTLQQSLIDLRTIPWNFPSMAGHLWFIYPLLGLYLFIPIISPWLEKASAKEERVFLAIFAAGTFIPYVKMFLMPQVLGECFWNGFHTLWYFTGYLGYLVMAHYIRFHLNWSRRMRLWVGAAAFLAGAAFTVWSFYHRGIPGQAIDTPKLEWGWEFCRANVVLATFGMFLLFTTIRKASVPPLVESLSKLSFGMYLVHLFYINLWGGIFIGEGGASAPLVPVAFAIPLIAAATFVSSALTCKLVSLIPGSRWIIGTISK